MRQRPETASGVTFLTMEDEHGMVNVSSGVMSPRLTGVYCWNQNCLESTGAGRQSMACAI
jgi:hypothetical protein